MPLCYSRKVLPDRLPHALSYVLADAVADVQADALADALVSFQLQLQGVDIEDDLRSRHAHWRDRLPPMHLPYDSHREGHIVTVLPLRAPVWPHGPVYFPLNFRLNFIRTHGAVEHVPVKRYYERVGAGHDEVHDDASEIHNCPEELNFVHYLYNHSFLRVKRRFSNT